MEFSVQEIEKVLKRVEHKIFNLIEQHKNQTISSSTFEVEAFVSTDSHSLRFDDLTKVILNLESSNDRDSFITRIKRINQIVSEHNILRILDKKKELDQQSEELQERMHEVDVGTACRKCRQIFLSQEDFEMVNVCKSDHLFCENCVAKERKLAMGQSTGQKLPYIIFQCCYCFKEFIEKGKNDFSSDIQKFMTPSHYGDFRGVLGQQKKRKNNENNVDDSDLSDYK